MSFSLLSLCPLPLLSCPLSPTPFSSTLSLHDALPDLPVEKLRTLVRACLTGGDSSGSVVLDATNRRGKRIRCRRSEEHTSELQSLTNLVCRLLLNKKKRTPAKQGCRRITSVIT